MVEKNRIEEFRKLWERILTSGKIEVCTDELKGVVILDVNVLRLLYANPEIRPKEIAARLQIPNSTLTNAINRLEKKGLLERKLNANDLRSLRLALTEEGKQAICSHQDAERALIKNIFDILDENESDAFVSILAKLVAAL